jgi:hypothetical protein
MIKRLQVRTNQHEEQNSTREKSHEAPCRNYCIHPGARPQHKTRHKMKIVPRAGSRPLIALH